MTTQYEIHFPSSWRMPDTYPHLLNRPVIGFQAPALNGHIIAFIRGNEPSESEQYQAFVESMVQYCQCCESNRPCEGVLAGGLCDRH